MQLARRPNSRAQSCTECRRRKQKCIPSSHGPCFNCARRYPLVECIGMSGSGDLVRLNKTRSYIQSRNGLRTSHKHEDNDINFKLKPELNEKCGAKFENQAHRLLKARADVQPNPDHNLLLSGGEYPCGSPRSFGGLLTGINSTNVISIYPSRQNTELFHIYQHTVAPFMFALSPDGQNLPTAFQERVMPWIMQSPLMPQIAIFTASAYRTHISGCELDRATQTIALKGKIYSKINHILEQDFDKIHLQIIQSVLQLVVLEWYSHDLVSLWAQMKGLKEMIRIRGGIAKLQNSLLRQTLILTDYELACFFQQDLYLLQPYERYSPAISASYPESYSSPLAESITTFRDIYERLDLHPLAASILDEIRSLTMSIYLLSTAEKNSSHSDKNSSFKYIHSTASRIHEDICSLPILPILTSSPTNNIIYEVIRLTALAYASCISTRTPFNLAYTPSVRKEVYSKIDLVRLNTWKRIPGIFLWILLVACPGSRYHAPLLIRSNVSATALYISFTDFGLAVGCLRAFWRVQRMIMSVKEENDEQIAEE